MRQCSIDNQAEIAEYAYEIAEALWLERQKAMNTKEPSKGPYASGAPNKEAWLTNPVEGRDHEFVTGDLVRCIRAADGLTKDALYTVKGTTKSLVAVWNNSCATLHYGHGCFELVPINKQPTQ